MHLAYCCNFEVFSKDRLRDKQWSYRFPGSGWITCLYSMAEKFAIDIASGDIAIENIVSKKWNAKDVYVIQDMISADATKLLDLGAKPFLITCFEAPLYAPFFYDDINKIAEHFNFRLGFGFTDEQSNNIPFHFPSFYLEDMLEIRSWKDRKKVVLVAANKYKTKIIFLPYASNQIRVLRQIKSAWWKIISPAYRKSLSLSLHDRRLEAIEYFASTNELDLFGAGWGNLGDLPTNWVNRLLNLIDRCHLGLCQDKLETISRYRFAICFENMQLSGYVTEKIVDCFVSGVVPLYLGAPDIEKIIPAESFVDIRMFKSFEGVEAYMNQMTECYAMSMIEAGRNYLRTEAGMLHSYEGFAQYVIRLAKSCRI
jgi:hypothetical protein